MKSISLILSALAATALAAPKRFGKDRSFQPNSTSFGLPGAISASSPSAAAESAAASYTITPAAHATGGESYIVIFNTSSPDYPEVADVLKSLDLSEDHEDVKYTYNNAAFRGFAASMKSHCLEALANMSGIAIVEPDVQVTAYNTVARAGAPWGLQRISSQSAISGDSTSLDFVYTYENSALGAGVDIYIVDTGVNTEHAVFGGRARMGYSFETDTTDGDGHGTHVSGTAAGAVLGAASGANIIGVKTLGSGGTGSSSDTAKGMDWVIQQHQARKSDAGFVGSVMSMSWGLESTNTAIDQVIRAAAAAGVHVSVAAGNNGADACAHSPGSSAGANGPAVAVGSVGTDNVISSFSNTGSCVDIYAPGEDVVSAWIGDTNLINTLSGTSMAAPHVTGIMAYLMVEHPELAQDPAAMKTYLTTTAIKNAVTGTANSGDAKLLVSNGETGTSAKRSVEQDKVQLRRRGLSSSGFSSVVEFGSKLSDKLSDIFRRGPAPMRLYLRDGMSRVAY